MHNKTMSVHLSGLIEQESSFKNRSFVRCCYDVVKHEKLKKSIAELKEVVESLECLHFDALCYYEDAFRDKYDSYMLRNDELLQVEYDEDMYETLVSDNCKELAKLENTAIVLDAIAKGETIF